MTRARHRRLALLGLALLGPLAFAGCLSDPLLGQPAPPFMLVLDDGRVVNESTFLGQYVILDLMATWCNPCRLEVAHLREVQRLYGERVVILSIGADSSETMADLDAFAERYGASWPHGLDHTGAINRAYGVRTIPKLVILDPEGIVAFARGGEVLPVAMARVIDPGSAEIDAPRASILPSVAALALGFFAAFNPYRALHRNRAGWRGDVVGGVILAALAVLAWPFSGLVSTRATYSSLLLAAIAIAAGFWWPRARDRAAARAEGQPPNHEGAPGPLALVSEGGDRAYEGGVHFALVIALGLQASGPVGFFAPAIAFLVGGAAAVVTRVRLTKDHRVRIGIFGLAFAGVGLLWFGSRAFLG